MTDHQHPRTSVVRYLNEVLLSMNIAVAIMVAVFFSASESVTLRFAHMETSIHRFLHIRETDYMLGHLQFFVPAAVLALCLWVGLRLSARTSFTREIIRSASGILAVGLTPAWWLVAMYARYRRAGWSPFRTLQLYEAVLILLCTLLYLAGKWPLRKRISVCILFAHNAFWIWIFGPYRVDFFNWQVSPFLGLFLSLAWVLYLAQLTKSPYRTPNRGSVL